MRICNICPTRQEFTIGHVLSYKHIHWIKTLPDDYMNMTIAQLRDYQKKNSEKIKRTGRKRKNSS